MAFDAGSIMARMELDDSDIKKGFGGIADGAKKLLESLGPGGKLALGGAAVFTGIAIAAKQALDAFGVVEAAVIKLNTALGNQGNLLPGVSRSLQQFAASMQDVSLFEAEAILSSQSFLASMGANADQIKELTPATVDYAQAMGVDLNTAFVNVGKAFAGQTSALGKLGIDTKSVASESERLKIIQEGLSSAFGGQALAATQSWSGQMTQLKNAAGDVVEEIGKFIRFLMVDFAGGVETSLGVLKSIASFFGETLPIVVSEARALFAEFMGSLFDMGAGVSEFLGKIPGLSSILPSPEIFRIMAEGQRSLATEVRASADAFVLSGGVTEEAENKSRSMTAATEELTKEQKKLQDQIASMAEQLGTAGLAGEAQIATLAIQQLGGAGNVSATGMQSISGLIDQLRMNSMALTPELRAVALELDKIALNKGMLEVAKSMEPLPITTEQWSSALQSIPPELGSIEAGVNAAFGPSGQALVGGIQKKTFDWGNAMSGVNDFLSEARGLMNLLGVEADSAFGKIISWVSKAYDSFNSLSGIVSRVASLFKGLGSSGGGGSLLGGVGRMFGIGGGATAAAGAVAGTSAIPVAGSFAGAGLSATVGGAGVAGAAGGAGAGIGMGALAATGYGAIAVAAIIAIRAALKKGSAETTAEFLGIDFDVLSKGLQKELQTMGKEMGDFSTALQLNLSSVFAEGGLGKNFDAFAMKIADTFSFLERRQITATQAQQVLNSTVGQLLPHLGELGQQGQSQVERLLRAAAATGIQFEGLEELVAGLGQSLLTEATAGGDAFLNSMNALGVTGRESLEFLKNFALESGIQFEGLDQIVALLANSLGSELPGAAASGFGAAAAEASELGRQLEHLRSLAGGVRFDVDVSGSGIPVVPAQHGFSGLVGGPMGPVGFIAGEAGIERVTIEPLGGKSQGMGGGHDSVANVTLGPVTINLPPGSDRDQADRIALYFEQNIAEVLTRVKKKL